LKTTATTVSFEQLGLSSEILKALRESEYDAPFPIQQEAIPLILKGIDVIGQAHTGTGKTAAFSLPILSRIRRNGPVQALILAPTRELAVQITTEINKFARHSSGIRTVCIYGGQNIGLQHSQLRRGVQIVVATPGRLIDHIKRESIHLNDVKYLILDEADRMLDMGFIDDIKFILCYVKEQGRQTCLFSATMPPEIRRLAQDYMHDAQEIRLNEDEISLDTIQQSYLVVREKEKFDHLRKFVENADSKQTIVFTATKQRAQRLLEDLRKQGFKATTIHGDLSQRQRDNAIYRFKKGIDNILVATDIAARGIDVPAVGHVINYDVPAETLMYFHRIGRTARAGGTGRAVSLVSDDRVEDFRRIINKTEQPIRRLNEEMGIAVPPPRQQYQSRRRNNYGYKPGFQRRESYSADKNYSHSRQEGNRSRHGDGYEYKRSTRYGFRSNRRTRWS